MLQEKCTKDMNAILHRTLARSFITEFASRLNVNVQGENEPAMEGGGPQQPIVQQSEPKSNANATQGGDPGRNMPSMKSTTNKGMFKASEGAATNPMMSLAASMKMAQNSKKQSAVNSEFNVTGMQNFDAQSQKSATKKYTQSEANKTGAPTEKPSPQSFNTSDPIEFARQVKSLAKTSPEDILMHRRQKHGQLRIGDVILLVFHEDIHLAELNEQRYANAVQSLQENLGNQQKPIAKKLRTLDKPDFRYKGVLFSNGITNQGINVIPQNNHLSHNASNLYKQCLFRIEIKQDCEINKKQIELEQQKVDLDNQLKKMIQDSGGEDQMNQSKLQQIKKEIQMVEIDITENAKKRHIQDENNKYEQKLQMGTKVTYGQPIQLYHLFSGSYLTLNLQEMSQEYGCCQMGLSEMTEQSWFTFQPAQSIYEDGQVINFNDYFYIQSLTTSTPFYFHVFRKPQDNIEPGNFNMKIFQLNAGQEPSPIKSKLFMSFDATEQEKLYIQSGDVIRLRHLESDGYISTTSMQVDQILPAYPDFLKAQIRRMERGEKVENAKGGKDKNDLTIQEKQEMKADEEFDKIYAEDINDEYTKILKSRLQEGVYVEQVHSRLYFTNSCWEVQRVNPLKGGNLILEEYYRFRHIGTGKYLAVGDDRTELILRNTACSPSTLFMLKSDMSTKNPDKFLDLDEDGDGKIDESKLLHNGQRVMISSYIEDGFLQLYEDVDSSDMVQFNNKIHHISDPFLGEEQSKGSQYRVINHEYQSKQKQRMLFYIEEVKPEDSLYSYQANCIFDELLEFFSFINIWGVKPIGMEESTEKYYYDNDLGIDTSDFLYERCEKVMYILGNLEKLIGQVEYNDDLLEKCKKELVEQGILDMICRCLELIYYKMAPPSMYMRSFKTTNQMDLKNKENPDKVGVVDPKQIKIDDYIVQEIFRDNIEPVMARMFDLVLTLIRANRQNSERITKYFSVMFQHFAIHQAFIEISLMHSSFNSQSSPKYIGLIGEIFRRAQKNSMYIFDDRSSNALVEYNKRLTKFEINKKVKEMMHKASNKVKSGQPHMMGIDSKQANENIERSSELNQVHRWLDLLEPVKFIDKNNQNLERQIMYMNVISMFCRDKEGNGVYPYQLQVVQHIFSKDEHIPLKFGTAKVGNVLRPFVYFVRPKALMNLSEFMQNNPILADIQDNFNMQQRSQNQYELIFDLHEMTKNYETKGKETWPYIDYICAVLNMYAHMCFSCNDKAIKALKGTGIDESFILCCIHEDTDKLVLHEKFKQSFMLLTRTMFVQNDPISPGIGNKNRCYVWDKLKPLSADNIEEEEDQFHENSQDEMYNIENDFYKGLEHKKKTQMDDPNNSMIVLPYEQDSKDLALIRKIKKNVVWFLMQGPAGTDSFFYHHHRRKFIRQSLKIKIKSLKIYLDTVFAIISEDCVDPGFIDNVKFICQCAVMGATHLSEDQETQVPVFVKSNWVYILMWIAKDITLNQTDTRQMKNALRAIEVKVLSILDKITSYRLNLQVHKFLFLFRRFQEQNLYPHTGGQKSLDLQVQFQNLFNFHQFDTDFKMSDEFMKKKLEEGNEEVREHLLKAKQEDVLDYDKVDGEHALINKKVPFDFYLMRYIFSNESTYEVRIKALQVLIRNFNQRNLLVKELARTDIIVSSEDYKIYFDFLQRQRQMKQLINKLVQDEMFHMIYKKSPSMETKNTKNDIINILQTIINTLDDSDPVQNRKLQNMLRHINIIDDLVNILLRRLIFKEFYYKDLFQQVIHFLFNLAYQNPNCQKHLLPDLNFFLDLMNIGIETGPLIAEVIKSNTDPEYSKGFIKYIVNKIVVENRFSSSLINQLIRLAQNASNIDIENDDSGGLKPVGQQKEDAFQGENSNQQFILKQIIKNQRFRSLLYMKKKFQQRKLAIIKTYAKKKEQYNISKKEDDAQIKFDKEQIDVHVAVVDLVAACAKNSAFGVAQAQKLIEAEELLDSLLSESIPFVIKKHYFNLLFEVYLRKVPGLSEDHRLKISDLKFAQVMKWVIQYDLEHSFNFFKGLVVEPAHSDPPDRLRKITQVNREVERVAIAEYDDKNMGKTEKDKDDERRFKAQLSSMSEGQPFFVLDTSDLSEFWRYLYQYNKKERTFDGLLIFIEQFYKDYSVAELNDENIQNITVKIRERLIIMVNKIYGFWEAHEGCIRDSVYDLMLQINKTVGRIPQMRAFRVGKRRVIKDGIITEVDDNNGERVDDSLNLDESRDLDNRMCGDKVLRLLRDHIIQQNTHIKTALGVTSITSDVMMDKDVLKNKIKAIVGGSALYDEIMKALDHFHKVSFEKRQERQVKNVEPGQEGYILNRNEATGNKLNEVKDNLINFRDIEIQIKDVLRKAGYKPPNQQRERGGQENEVLLPKITDRDMSIAINMDLKLFVQRFFEFVHMTQNVAEIHDFVNKLMQSDFIKDREAKVQLIKNLLNCFRGLEGIDDELILISTLHIILQRLVPDDEEMYADQDQQSQKVKRWKKKNEQLKKELREWQEIMYECEVPQLMISLIDINNDPYLSHKALTLLNSILFKQSEAQQLEFLTILQRNNQYFKLFFYLKQRLQVSKNYLVEKILNGAKDKYVANMQKFINTKKVDRSKDKVLFNDFKNQKVFLEQKYDLEYKYQELQDTWRQYELNVLLQFLNQLCENCFKPAQLFLKEQIVDNENNFKDKNRGKICSINLVYQVVVTFIDIVDILGDYVFSDFRTYKLIPLLLDTIIEFIYGPCLENQIFLGKWKKLIAVINSLINSKDYGNYSGVHQEAKSQLAILYSCSQVLLAIVDIKDPEGAKITHDVVMHEIDIDNLIRKMVEIFIFKIGGTPERRRIYEYNIQCQHYKATERGDDGGTHCIENEFCEHGHLIPRDQNTIQTGFNIYQILQILYKHYPNHPSLRVFNRDFNKYNYLWRDYGLFYSNVYKEATESNTSLANFSMLLNFNRSEQRLLDQLIIKSFPEVYLDYLERVSSENSKLKKSALLLQVIQVSRTQKSNFDQTKILEKVQEKIQKELEEHGSDIHHELAVLDDTQADEGAGALDSLNPLAGPQGGIISKDDLRARGPINLVKALIKGYKNKIETEKKKRAEEKEKEDEAQKHALKSFKDLSPEEKMHETRMKRVEFEEKLKLFKFYLASNFYDDNIGKVEIVQNDGSIIETTFKFPSFSSHLTRITRKSVPQIIFQVSQQEKLEAFMGQIELYRTEMVWQQKLGQISGALKAFANSWKALSWINFILICIVNLMFINYLIINDDLGKTEMENAWQNIIVRLVGYAQTGVAAIVVLSYYIEYRANFIYQMNQVDSDITGALQDYGLNKGSLAFGDRKSLKFSLASHQSTLMIKLRIFSKKNFFAKIIYLLAKEAIQFVRAVAYSTDHLRNIIYLVVSIIGINENFFTALLLLDIIYKIPQLTQVLRVFDENKIHLTSVLGLFFVVLYISSFFAFGSFRDDYQHAADADDDDGPDFNMYCNSLAECLLSTANVGIRAGGGVGEALNQPVYMPGQDNSAYYQRYAFDLVFFLVINIVLMNIFFGIIIDSFADKRALDNENKNEMEGQCFICGITKSRFDIENIPWRDHVYQQHNMHAYLAFILYVNAKSKAECTGVEKFVKEKIKSGNIDFFPVNRCLAVRGGEELNE